MEREKQTTKITVQDIVDGVTEMIKTGEFQPGAPIREVELCGKFGVSRTPVREALRVLQNRGIVEYIPRCGVQAVELTMEDLNHATDLRTVVEALSARKAAANAAEDDIRKLREINRIFLETEDPHERGRIDYEFHEYIAEMSGNPLIHTCLRDIYMRQSLLQWRIPFRPERVKFSFQEHENIIRAMEKKDEELAELQTKVHFHNSQKSLQKKMAEYERRQQETK